MIEKLDTNDTRPVAIIEKLNELIEAYNQHIHYGRELQSPTSTPDNPKVYSE